MRLQPGKMKTVKISFNFNGKLMDLMHGFLDGCHPDPHIKYAMGTAIMIALEKVMQTGANVISINWQATMLLEHW